MNDELANSKLANSDVMVIKEENDLLVQKIENLQVELDGAITESGKLFDDLERQQTLYNELKKMRGRGEEMDLIQRLERVSFPSGNDERTSFKRRHEPEIVTLNISGRIRDLANCFF